MMFITSECERMGSMNYKNIFDALNMTFRPAARCGLDVGGNLRHRIGSAWSGGFYLSIAGRFLRRFRDWVAGEWFPELLPGGAERKRDVSGWCSADCAPPGGDDWSCMARPPCLSGARGKMPRHVIVITPPRHGPCDLPSSSGALFAGDSVLRFLNLAFLLLVQGMLPGQESVAQDRRAFFGGGLHEFLLCLGIPLRISQAGARKTNGEKWPWRGERKLTSHRAGPRRALHEGGLRQSRLLSY